MLDAVMPSVVAPKLVSSRLPRSDKLSQPLIPIALKLVFLNLSYIAINPSLIFWCKVEFSPSGGHFGPGLR